VRRRVNARGRRAAARGRESRGCVGLERQRRVRRFLVRPAPSGRRGDTSLRRPAAPEGLVEAPVATDGPAAAPRPECSKSDFVRPGGRGAALREGCAWHGRDRSSGGFRARGQIDRCRMEEDGARTGQRPRVIRMRARSLDAGSWWLLLRSHHASCSDLVFKVPGNLEGGAAAARVRPAAAPPGRQAGSRDDRRPPRIRYLRA